MSVSVYPRSTPTALVAEASNRLLLDLSYARGRRTRAGGAPASGAARAGVVCQAGGMLPVATNPVPS